VDVMATVRLRSRAIAVALVVVVPGCLAGGPARVAGAAAATTTALAPIATSHIAQVWANTGEDKVAREELRATVSAAAVRNAAWDGSQVSLFGAGNETVAFNLVMEAAGVDATVVSVRLAELDGPGGARITTKPATGSGVFDYVGRNIELFYIRYLQIKGLSRMPWEPYDERHVPEYCQRPNVNGEVADDLGWTDRPCHDQSYPDIAVPLELKPTFTIAHGTNQSIWGDITIPAGTTAGTYTGTIEVSENGTVTWRVPISLRVRDFALPDVPSAKTMLYVSWENVFQRMLGVPWVDPEGPLAARARAIQDRFFQLAHRYGISLIDGGASDPAEMDGLWTGALDGSLFTAVNHYAGRGVGTGNGVYSIGTYGSWSWQDGTEQDMWTNADAWVNWFDAHPFATPTDYFLYLIDESDDYPQTEKWAEWLDADPGPGHRLKSMATIGLPDAVAHTPSLDVVASAGEIGITDAWQNALAATQAIPGREVFLYNGTRPATGTFATEDDGVALRALAWSQFKKGIDRWFYWESTYYTNFQHYSGSQANTNVFQTAVTFGKHDQTSSVFGQTGNNYMNGDGVLFYPGTETMFPADSYGVDGPIASLRLKLWRRGIQDVDFLTMAAAVNPTATAAIVNRIVPKVLWEYGVDELSDPTYVHTDIGWSNDPDVWDAARAQLADIIEGGASGAPGAPRSVTAEPADGQATVSWLAPTSTGASAISGYTVTAASGGPGCTTTGVRTCTVSGLADGQAYTFRVTASNGAGAGPPSAASGAVVPGRTTLRAALARATIGASGNARIPVTLAWSGTIAASNVRVWTVERRAASGAWVPASFTSRSAASGTVTLAPGAAATFRARPVTQAGAIGPWSPVRTVTAAARQDSSAAIRWRGTGWRKANVKSAYGGTLRFASARGRTATTRLTGTSIAWVSNLGRDRGRADVMVDGKRVATVSLYRRTGAARQVVWSRDLAAGAHTVTIRVLGTHVRGATGNRVDLDAFLVLQ
jgi:hypothetical protein